MIDIGDVDNIKQQGYTAICPPAATYMRTGVELYQICGHRSVHPHTLPAESQSFIGMARETAAIPLHK